MHMPQQNMVLDVMTYEELNTAEIEVCNDHNTAKEEDVSLPCLLTTCHCDGYAESDKFLSCASCGHGWDVHGLLVAPGKERESAAAGASKPDTDLDNSFGLPTKSKLSQMLAKGAEAGCEPCYGFRWEDNSCALDSLMAVWIFGHDRLFNSAERHLFYELLPWCSMLKGFRTLDNVAQLKQDVVRMLCKPHQLVCKPSCTKHAPLPVFYSLNRVHQVVINSSTTECRDFVLLVDEINSSCTSCAFSKKKKVSLIS